MTGMLVHLVRARRVRHGAALLAALLGVVAWSGAAGGQDATYPARGKRISIIAAASAGSGTDLTARLVAQALESEFPGTNFVVINRPGAGTQVGVQATADAAPDGSTFGLISLPTAVTLTLDPARKARFDRESFVPIGNFIYDPGALAVRTDSPYRSLKDFTEAARQKPGTVTVGVTGPRGREHLDLIAVERASGASFTPVFHNDSGLALNALLGGHIDAVQGSVADFLAQMKAGRVRLLAVFDKSPSAFAPDVPTAESQGFPIFSGTSRGFAFPAKTPPQYAARISEALGKIARSPEYQQKVRDMGLELRYMDATEYGAYWANEVTRIKELMARLDQR
ncbi:MAG TPA: tripartite tricarboxylate transporter substrate binding protein [Thermodesulfobacteriota bacterium]